MKTLYLDCPMGISGDMFLAALIDLGASAEAVLADVRRIPGIEREIDVKISRVKRHSIGCTTFRVGHTEAPGHRSYRDIKALIRKSTLSEPIKKLSNEIFRLIAVAEGRVHGITPERVHFHEVGAIDSIIDIVGAASIVTQLGVEQVACSPLPLGTGWANTMHGRIPVPAPATLEILKGVPLAKSTAPFELTTPTGAAIARALSSHFGEMPEMTVEAIGYGAGKKDFEGSANLLRAVVGTAVPFCAEANRGTGKGAGKDEAKKSKKSSNCPADTAAGRIVVIESNIDDMTPQAAGYLMERLFEAGALDAYFTPVQMKKNRPGVLLTVLARPGTDESLKRIIFTESTTIGVRSHVVERECLERRTVRVKTPWGQVRVKVAERGGAVVNAEPEYEDCRELARRKKTPLASIMDAARTAALGLLSGAK